MWWIPDPKSKEPSVTLTFCVVFGAVALVGAVTEFTGHGSSPNAAVDLFWGALAAYVGRKFSFGGKKFDGSGDEPK